MEKEERRPGRGDRVLHRRHPEWGVGVVLSWKHPGYLVRFERSHTLDGKHWGNEWICSPGNLENLHSMTETEAHQAAEALRMVRAMEKIREAEQK